MAKEIDWIIKVKRALESIQLNGLVQLTINPIS